MRALAACLPELNLQVTCLMPHRHSYTCMYPTTDTTTFLNWELFDDMRIELDTVFKVLSKGPGNKNYYYL